MKNSATSNVEILTQSELPEVNPIYIEKYYIKKAPFIKIKSI